MRFDGDSPGPLPRGAHRAPEAGPYWLDPDELIQLVRLGPLVSIDLVVRNGEGRILVGHRINEPAKDHWFVPGGRMGKGESLDEAFRRIVRQELGISRARKDASLLGVFEHFYETNFLEQPDLGTHYVVLAHGFDLEGDGADIVPDEQHRQVRWLTPAELSEDLRVHRNSRVYGSLEL
ncbi:MAG: NUDIX domain-containing protein [Gemmatimonadota bacterium]|nr:NUDIX domain-containing protein [Gemmatimonadota bacterium]